MTTKTVWEVCVLKLTLDGKPALKPTNYWTLCYTGKLKNDY